MTHSSSSHDPAQLSQLKAQLEPADAHQRLQRIWREVDARLDQQRASWWTSSRLAWSGCVALAGLALALLGTGALDRVAGALGSPAGATAVGDSPAGETAAVDASRTGDARARAGSVSPARVEMEHGAEITTDVEQRTFELNDGSAVSVGPRSDLKMTAMNESQTALTLSRGRVHCNVAHNPQRDFLVRAGPVLVRVIGTEFSVEVKERPAQPSVRVQVERGIVEVIPREGQRLRLSAGETWEVDLRESEAELSAGASTANSSKADGAGPASSSPAMPTPDAASRADAWFAEARRHRHAGEWRAAADQYAALLRTYPSDPRTGIVALELGRIRMDQLGDPAGALAPLRAAERATQGGLADDALARQVRALWQLGDVPSCQRARTRYLERYPSGVHAQSVRELCSP